MYHVAVAGWSAVDLKSWQLDESGEVPGVNGADPGCREGAIQVHFRHMENVAIRLFL